MRRLAIIAVGVTVAIMLAGCAVPRPFPAPTPRATETLRPSGDGVLRIGTLFPMSGDVSFIGPAMVAAVEVAVRDINAAGGVLDQPVEVLYRDSGDASQQRLETAFADLVERGVDVVIGPATSALAAAPGVFFRTIVGYDQQAAAIVRELAARGDESVALVTTGDALGFAFELAVRAELERQSMRLQGIEQLDAATNVDRVAFSIVGGEPDAVILATGAPLATQNQAVIAALAERGIGGEQLWLTAQNLADYSATVAAGVLEGANGVLEGATVSDELVVQLRQSDPALLSFRYAPETYDAVVLAALAAVLAADDGGPSIAAFLPMAATDGAQCSSFGECIEALETVPSIDYDGISGALTLDDAGGVVAGKLGLYRYTAENRPERVGTIPIVAR